MPLWPLVAGVRWQINENVLSQHNLQSPANDLKCFGIAIMY